ncbi:MAG: hypothetical protein HC884_09010 [Chloroflexaceae bacterium]|nr:hypothetical protein [Chloroflexaceae bacterium]
MMAIILQALLDNLVFAGLNEIRRKAAGRTLTVKEVQDAVGRWMRTSKQGFATHTPGLDDPVSVSYGFAAPGFDTPAAGLLLPVVGEATTVRDGAVGQLFALPNAMVFAVAMGNGGCARLRPFWPGTELRDAQCCNGQWRGRSGATQTTKSECQNEDSVAMGNGQWQVRPGAIRLLVQSQNQLRQQKRLHRLFDATMYS